MAVDERRPYAFMTKTQHYRKITKPLLERKRRARMNLYIDELKDLIVDTMEAQGEHVAKWEKADILEMTVNYLKMQRHKNFQSETMQTEAPSTCGADNVNFDKFRAGYTQAAYEVSKVFANLPGLDIKFKTRLMQQLGGHLKDLPPTKKQENSTVSSSPSSMQQQQQHSFAMPNQTHNFPKRMEPQLKHELVWRPW